MPAGWRVGCEPITHGGILDTESTRLLAITGLRPIYPEAEFQSALMRVTGKRCQTLRKSCGMRVLTRVEAAPFAHACLRMFDHLPNLGRIDRYAVAPAIVRQPRVGGIAQSGRIIQDGAHPVLERIAGIVDAAAARADKHSRCDETVARHKACAKWPRFGIQPSASF